MHGLALQSAKGKAQRGLAPEKPVWLSTNLKETDVIGGGEQKLRNTILYADRTFTPDIIFVVSTCAPNIIGDDVEEVVREARLSASADVVSLHCPGFKSRVVASAYDAFYHGLLRHVSFEPNEDKSGERLLYGREMYEQRRRFENARTVNLWNATSIGAADEEELTRLLGALGLRVRVCAEYSSRDKLRRVSEAALNISMCNVHDDYILKYLKEKYGTSYVIAGMPIGPQATRQWLLAIARHFEQEEQASRLADAEEAAVKPAAEPFLKTLRGKRVLIGGGVVRVGVEARLLAELGMEVLGVRLYHYDDGAAPVLEETVRALPDAHFSVSNQAFELVNQIKRLKPDLVVTHNGTHGQAARAGAASVQLFSADGAFFGYSGYFALVRRLTQSLKNTSYQKRLSQHARLPYRESWYERDAFSYVF
jgi:nitrogenase molybdenum-iron protein alpha chain